MPKIIVPITYFFIVHTIMANELLKNKMNVESQCLSDLNIDQFPNICK